METIKELNILEDDSIVIKYEQVEKVVDTINRNDVANIESQIIAIENEIAEKNELLESLKEKLAFAKDIIAKADAEKEAQLEAVEDETTNEENVQEDAVEY